MSSVSENLQKIVVLCVIVGAIVGGVFVYNNYYKANINKEGGVACTQEAKLCPDGSYVGRTGPNCEFAECSTTDNNYVYIEKFGLRFAIDESAPKIVVTNDTGNEHEVYLSTQNFIDKVGGTECGNDIVNLWVFKNMDELIANNEMLAGVYNREELSKELHIHELNDGRVWYELGQTQAVCYDPDPQLQFTEGSKITPYLETLEPVQ